MEFKEGTNQTLEETFSFGTSGDKIYKIFSSTLNMGGMDVPKFFISYFGALDQTTFKFSVNDLNTVK
eukprot:UN27319